MSEVRVLASPADTQRLGAELAAELPPGGIVGLVGVLGAGKTTLAAGLLSALEVEGDVVSPTFLGLRRYRTRAGGVVYHVDLYRTRDAAWLWGEGFFDDLDAGARAVIEWIDRDPSLAEEAWVVVELAVEGSGRRATIVRRS